MARLFRRVEAMGGRGAVSAAIVVWGGLLAGAGLDPGTALGALGALVFLPLFSLVAWRGPDRVGTLALLLALALAASARGGARSVALAREREGLPEADGLVRIVGRVVEPPQREAAEPLAIVSVTRSQPPLPPGTRVRLVLPEGDRAEWGDRIFALARIEAPRPPRNPGGFDARAAADAAGLAASGRALDARSEVAAGFHAWPRATVARWRRALEGRLRAGLSPGARELVLPLVVGDRTALPTDLSASFRASGLIHLLALSGLHVAWLAALARGAAASLGGGPVARAIAGGLCALLYLGIAGPLPSLARAVATELATACARLFDRALDPVQALALSALALLVAAPGWVGDLGFQLSCAATAGLVTVGPWLTARCGRMRSGLLPFVPTVSASLTAMPLLLLRFHAFPWVGAFANLAAVPVCGLLLSAAWLAALADAALPGTAGPWFGACEVLAALLTAIANRAAAAPGALVATGPETAVPLLAGIGAALLALALPEPRDLAGARRPASRARVAGAALGALAVALALALGVTRPALAPPAGRWWCVVLDVGQGDAVALGSGGRWWLVDAGGRSPRYDAGESAVLPFLRWAAVRRLEALAFTHDDGDHTGGAAALLRGVGARRVWTPAPLPGVPGPVARFAAAAHGDLRDRAGPAAPESRAVRTSHWPPLGRGRTTQAPRPAAAPAMAPQGRGLRIPGDARLVTVSRGDTLSVWPRIVVLWPPRAFEPAAAGLRTDNAAGLVLEVGEGAGRALLAADVDSTAEESLAVAPGVALLKIAHHGSGSSSGARFLASAHPRHGALSSGARNPFGHPHPGALERLRAAGVTLHRTDREGALWFELSPEGVQKLDWRRGDPTRFPPATPWRPHGAHRHEPEPRP